MKIFNMIKKFITRAVSAIKGWFNGRSVPEAIADGTKIVTTVVTGAVAVYAAFNGLRVSMMRPAAATVSANFSGHDILMKNAANGSYEEKMRKVKEHNALLGRQKVKQEGADLLARIAKTRNVVFQSMEPEMQMDVLRREGFDCKAFLEQEKFNSVPHLLYFRTNKLGNKEIASTFKFVDSLLKPIRRFVRWYKLEDDPNFKTINVVKPGPIVLSKYTPEEIAEFQNMFHFGEPKLPEYLVNPDFQGVDTMIDSSALVLGRIQAQEVFKHKTLDAYRKAVRKKMRKSEHGSLSVYDMMDDDKERKKKKKKKGGKKGKKNKEPSLFDTFSGSFLDETPKKGAKLTKEEKRTMSEAERKSRALYEEIHHQIMTGDYYGFGTTTTKGGGKKHR